MTSPRPPRKAPFTRRAGAWLTWWVLLMSFWVILDDSIAADELLAGAGAAALAAFLAELVTYQAATRLRIRAGWLAAAFGLPGEVARDTGTMVIHQLVLDDGETAE
jgi:fatty acid desaturase